MNGKDQTEPTISPNAKNDSILAFLSPFLVYPVAADDTPPYERIAWWKFIFSCLGIKKQDHLQRVYNYVGCVVYFVMHCRVYLCGRRFHIQDIQP